MDIYIKSFNRPYYLERCLRSLQMFAVGSYSVTVLDDGTPPEYLLRIQTLFPQVRILRSDQYDAKVQALDDHHAKRSNFKLTQIPSEFWYASIEQGSEIFALLEEDAWLTEMLNVNDIESVALRE